MAETRHPKTKLHRFWRTASLWIRWLLVVVVILIAARLALPYVLKSYVNRQLAKTREYRGHIGDLDVHLYRGAYQIQNIEIVKTSGDVMEPLFAAAVVDLSIQWKELFYGSVVGKVKMRDAKLNFVSGPTEEETQTGKGVRWDKTLESLFPFKLNRLDIEKSQIHFQNLHASPPVDIFLNEMYATATNLTNARDLKTELPAGVTARGTTVGAADWIFNFNSIPWLKRPRTKSLASLQMWIWSL